MKAVEEILRAELAKYQYRDVYGSIGLANAVYRFVDVFQIKW